MKYTIQRYICSRDTFSTVLFYTVVSLSISGAAECKRKIALRESTNRHSRCSSLTCLGTFCASTVNRSRSVEHLCV